MSTKFVTGKYTQWMLLVQYRKSYGLWGSSPSCKGFFCQFHWSILFSFWIPTWTKCWNFTAKNATPVLQHCQLNPVFHLLQYFGPELLDRLAFSIHRQSHSHAVPVSIIKFSVWNQKHSYFIWKKKKFFVRLLQELGYKCNIRRDTKGTGPTYRFKIFVSHKHCENLGDNLIMLYFAISISNFNIFLLRTWFPYMMIWTWCRSLAVRQILQGLVVKQLRRSSSFGARKFVEIGTSVCSLNYSFFPRSFPIIK